MEQSRQQQQQTTTAEHSSPLSSSHEHSLISNYSPSHSSHSIPTTESPIVMVESHSPDSIVTQSNQPTITITALQTPVTSNNTLQLPSTDNPKARLTGGQQRRTSPLISPQISASPSQLLCAEILSKASNTAAIGKSPISTASYSAAISQSPNRLLRKWPFSGWMMGRRHCRNPTSTIIATTTTQLDGQSTAVYQSSTRQQSKKGLLGGVGANDKDDSEEEFMFVRTLPCTASTFSRCHSSGSLVGLRPTGGGSNGDMMSTTASTAMLSSTDSGYKCCQKKKQKQKPRPWWLFGGSNDDNCDDKLTAAFQSEVNEACQQLLLQSEHTYDDEPSTASTATSAWKKIATFCLIWACMVAVLLGVVLVVFSTKPLDQLRVHGFKQMLANRTVFETEIILSAYNPNICTINIGDYSRRLIASPPPPSSGGGGNDSDDEGDEVMADTDIILHLFVKRDRSVRRSASQHRRAENDEISVGLVEQFYQFDQQSNNSRLARLTFLPLTTSLMKIRIQINDPALTSLRYVCVSVQLELIIILFINSKG
jgi:hypothetical protein